MMDYSNTGKIVDSPATESTKYYEPTDNEKEILAFVIDHTDRWRDYRDQNYIKSWEQYERIFRGIWKEEDKTRQSERSRIISPATQQAIETRHAEIMEAIFGQGEYFDIEDDLGDKNPIDVEQIKNKLKEDFKRDKIEKSIAQIELMAEIYGTGIGEIIIGKEKTYVPHTQQMGHEAAYGVLEMERVFVRLNPINPKNFLFDPNGTSVDDCMGVAIEKYSSVHKIMAGIKSGKYKNVDFGESAEDQKLEPTQEITNFQDQKVRMLTYYGLVPSEYLQDNAEELFPEDAISSELEDYADMVEAVVIIADGKLLRAEKTPYMMNDRPVISYQDDIVPNRLLGRGTAEKAFNMQMAIDGSMRSHMDSLALTSAPMTAMDATRVPRGMKYEIKPGKNWLFNGNPNEILYPFKFGSTDGQSMETSREFERMLLMATSTLDSQGMVTQGSRDAGGLAPAVAGIIKKYKRTLINFQDDFMIPFINKAVWRYMQFAPERYPSVDVKFIPTATMGIIAREYEQQQIAFLVQTLGGNSPLTPILMKGILKNSSFSERESMIVQLDEMSKPNPQQQQMAQQKAQAEMELINANVAEAKARAEKAMVDARLAPALVNAEVNKVEKQIVLENTKAAHLMNQEQVRSQNDLIIERGQAQADQQTEQYKAELQASSEARKLDFERWKVEFEAQVKLEIANKQNEMKSADSTMKNMPDIVINMPTGKKKLTTPDGRTYTSEDLP